MALTVEKKTTQVTASNTSGDVTIDYTFRINGTVIEGNAYAKLKDADGKNLGQVSSNGGETFNVNLSVDKDFDSGNAVATAKADLLTIYTETASFI